MANELSTISPKGFLSRPEGKFGLVIPIVMGIIIVYFFGSAIGDFVVNAADNLLHLVIVGTASAALLWMLFDSKFRTMVFYLYRSLMRWITAQFIDIDPIGILKTYKEQMMGKLNDMKESLDKLKGQKIKVTRLLEAKQKDIDNQLHLLQQAKIQNDLRNESLVGKQVARLQDMINRYTGDLTTITTLVTVMNRYYGLCEDTVTDMDNEIKYRQETSAYSKESRNVVRSAMSIMKGLPEQDMWDDSLAALETQYTQAMGEVDGFLDVTKNILTQADLQDGASASKALEMLDAWEKQNAGVSLGGVKGQVTKAAIIHEAKQLNASTAVPMSFTTAKPNYAAVPVKNNGGDDYSTFLK
jgi:hypothetical protein